jgi:hypothetical protein
MLSVEISTESIYCSKYLSRVIRYRCWSVTRGVSDIPSVYAGMQSSTAVLRKGNDVAGTPRHPDGVAYVTSPSNEARQVVLPLIHV